jgi:hypothetical protein
MPNNGSFYVKNKEGMYVNVVKQAGIKNPIFGYRAVSLDLNGNGFKDLVVANIDGPMRVFLNDCKMKDMVAEEQDEVSTDPPPKVKDCGKESCSVCQKEVKHKHHKKHTKKAKKPDP